MCHTNTRSRLRGRELNYGLDVEQFLNTRNYHQYQVLYGMLECQNAGMHELRIKFFRFTIIIIPSKSSFQCKSSISYTAYIMLLPCNICISNNLSSYHNTNYVIIVTVKYMFCKSYKKDQQIIIVDFICIGLIHCITKVF